MRRRGLLPNHLSSAKRMKKKIKAAKDFLNNILDRPAKWLWAPRVFVANVTPSQVREIAKSPLIKVIHPNRSR
jgi:hypothetical protein